MVDEASDETVVPVVGALDERSAPGVVTRATRQLDSAQVRRLVVDVGAMDFMDSSGIGALVTMHSLAIAANATMILRGASPQAAGLLERVGLAHVLHIEP